MRRNVIIFLTVAVAALAFTAAAWALRFTDESYFTPVGAVGSPYSHTFGGAGGCGPALPYQYTLLSGSLPPGLSLSQNGHIGGTPTQAGSWSFWVNLSDQNPPSAEWCRPEDAQREFSITIAGTGGGSPAPTPAPGPTLSISTAALDVASVGSPYSLTLAASGSSAQTWTIVAGTLPSGLSLASNGVLSGTPQAAGTATFTVQVSAGTASTQKQFTLLVDAALRIDAPASQVAEVGVPLTVELHVGGGGAPYRWELTHGSLPVNVGFIGNQGNGSTATIKGVPAAPGPFALTFSVTDVRGRRTVHTITLQVADPLRLTGVKMPRFGYVGRVYRARVLAEGGFGARTWSIARGKLPAGLQLDTRTGVVGGRPRRAGRYVIFISAKDALGASRSMKISILVRR